MEHQAPEQKKHFIKAMTYLVAWILVYSLLYRNFIDSNGLAHLVDNVKQSNYSLVVLVIFSVILLALFIRSMTLFFNPAAGHRK